VHKEACVPEKDLECPWTTEVKNGAMKTDGKGGCTLECWEDFEEDPADRYSCRKICEGSPATGAFFDDECKEVCEDSNMHVHEATNSCVLRTGVDCGDAPAGGTSTANGDGTCTKACNEQGMVVAGGECVVPKLACNEPEFEFGGACYAAGEEVVARDIENGKAVMSSHGTLEIACDTGFKYDPTCSYAKCVDNDAICLLPG
jgi:hypothetical protein